MIILNIINNFLRYAYICHKKNYKKYFELKYTILFSCLSWFLGIIMDLPNYLGLGGHYFDKKTYNCTWNRLNNRIYTLLLMFISILIPSFLILIFYFRIYIFVMKSKQKLFSYTRKKKIKLEITLRVAKGLFLSFLIFAICWMPYALIIVIDKQDKISQTIYIYSILLATLNSSLNPILYAFTNSQFKLGYKNFFDFLFNRRNYSYSRQTIKSKTNSLTDQSNSNQRYFRGNDSIVEMKNLNNNK